MSIHASMAQHSKENPSGIGFRFFPKHITSVKHSIAALCDSEFNPKGLGLVDITDVCFQITVVNVDTNVVGTFTINWDANFRFIDTAPTVHSMIDLNQFYQILDNATFDDILTVFHLFVSDHLSLFFARAPTEELKVEFLDMDPGFQKLPDMGMCCETQLKSEFLRLMEQFTDDGELVTMDISEKLVNIVVRPGDSWYFQMKEDDENFGASIYTDAKKYHAKFILKHMEAMKKASMVEPQFHVACLDDPLGHIMIRFNIEGLGQLAFIHKAIVIMKNPIKRDITISLG